MRRSMMPSVPANPQSMIPVPSVIRTASISENLRVRIVKVGAGGFQFEPNISKNVSIGDIVTFEFYPSATRLPARIMEVRACRTNAPETTRQGSGKRPNG
ncbi:hypothetical protein GQ44DRAFT_715941 [Phaeosphaeriaceae sp. PMI808]|nr:hypothetical protein GQ44DRAFT_715941 [Phaeosphaeriaceae sp. PMI808]